MKGRCFEHCLHVQIYTRTKFKYVCYQVDMLCLALHVIGAPLLARLMLSLQTTSWVGIPHEAAILVSCAIIVHGVSRSEYSCIICTTDSRHNTITI